VKGEVVVVLSYPSWPDLFRPSTPSPLALHAATRNRTERI